MAVRFQCASCSQPIEVDDEWASKMVACPFCRKTMLAPAASTLLNMNGIPVASPLSAERYGQEHREPGLGAAAGATRSNGAAVAAIVLAALQILLLVIIQWVLVSHRLEVEEFQKTFGGKNFQEIFEAQRRYFEARGGVPRWMVGVGVMEIVAVMAWVATIVCGIIGVRRLERRGLAVTALMISGVLAIFLCVGFAQAAAFLP